jgi:hypothetical protein
MLLCFIRSKKQAAHILLVHTACRKQKRSEGAVVAVTICPRFFYSTYSLCSSGLFRLILLDAHPTPSCLQVAMSNNRPSLPPISGDSCPAELAQLMSDMWAANPRERPSSGEVMKALAQMVRVMLHA